MAWQYKITGMFSPFLNTKVVFFQIPQVKQVFHWNIIQVTIFTASNDFSCLLIVQLSSVLLFILLLLLQH